MLDFELDADEYPTAETLAEIADWSYSHQELMGLIQSIFPSYGRCDNKGTTWTLITGGWSGCESIVRALEANSYFWAKCWGSSSRGGRYVFEVDELDG